MGFVPARCTQCGASIKVDESKDAGICEYCGTPFVTEKVINNYNTTINHNYAGATINIVGGDKENLLKLAETSFDSGKKEEALDYVNRALELDAKLVRAWLFKTKIIAHTSVYLDTVDKVFNEIAVCGNQVTDKADEDKNNAELIGLYKLYCQIAIGWLKWAKDLISDQDKVHNEADFYNIGGWNSYMREVDSPYIEKIERVYSYTYQLITAIPPKYVVMGDDYKDIWEKFFGKTNEDSGFTIIGDSILQYITLYAEYEKKKSDRLKTFHRYNSKFKNLNKEFCEQYNNTLQAHWDSLQALLGKKIDNTKEISSAFLSPEGFIMKMFHWIGICIRVTIRPLRFITGLGWNKPGTYR